MVNEHASSVQYLTGHHRSVTSAISERGTLREKRWTTFHEQGWVISDERPSSTTKAGSLHADFRCLQSTGLVDHFAGASGSQVHRWSHHGFNLHAGVRVSANDRSRLARVFRYVLRPPIPMQQLSLSSDGRIICKLRKPWSDGTHAVAFSPHEFIAKTLPLIPKPRTNTIRYHGVFASRSKARRFVVREPEGKKRKTKQLRLGLNSTDRRFNRCHQHAAHRHRMEWQEMIRHTFAADVETCPHCQRGRMRLVRAIGDPASIRALLESIGERAQKSADAEAPPKCRGPPWLQMRLPFGDGPTPVNATEPSAA